MWQSLAADEFRALAGSFLVHALAGATVLGEAFLGKVVFLEHMRVADRDAGHANHTHDSGAALRTLRQRHIGEPLQHVEMRLAMGESFSGGGVFVDWHG